MNTGIEILQWLIMDINFSNPEILLDTRKQKEIPLGMNTNELFILENETYKGRELIRLEDMSILFYPLVIKHYLENI